MSLTKSAFADRVLALVHDLPPSPAPDVAHRLTLTDPDGHVYTLSRTDYADGFVEVFAKSTPHKAWVYLRSQNPTTKGITRGDWVALPYA